MTYQEKHKAVLNDIRFHPNGLWFVAAGGDDSGGILTIWDTKKKHLAYKAKPKGHIQRLVFSPNGQRLFMVGHDGFQVWNCGEA